MHVPSKSVMDFEKSRHFLFCRFNRRTHPNLYEDPVFDMTFVYYSTTIHDNDKEYTGVKIKDGHVLHIFEAGTDAGINIGGCTIFFRSTII